jgi:glycosyltransferase involved in cell wall biosynthesis
VALACRQAHLVLTVSEYSRRCLQETLHIPEKKLRVVNEAGDPAFHHVPAMDTAPVFERLKVPVGSRLLVYVGGFSPHKNLVELAGYFGAAFGDSSYADVRLVLVGDFETDPFYSCFPMLQRQIQKHGIESRVLFPGYMKDDELRALFHACAAVVLPSRCEGFGLPAVEAAACGAPSVVTTESPLPELLGEGALAVPPGDTEGWVHALVRVVSDADLRRRMGVAALAAAEKLSWKAAAQQLLNVFQEVHSRATAA